MIAQLNYTQKMSTEPNNLQQYPTL